MFIRGCYIEKRHDRYVITDPKGYELDLIFWDRHDAVAFVCEHY